MEILTQVAITVKEQGLWVSFFSLRAEHPAPSYLQLLGLGEQFERQLIDRCLGAFVTHFERCLYFKYLVYILQLYGKEKGLKRP